MLSSPPHNSNQPVNHHVVSGFGPCGSISPNRSLKSSPNNSPTRLASKPSSLPSSPSSSSPARLSQKHLSIATRKISQFMNSILVRPVPEFVLNPSRNCFLESHSVVDCSSTDSSSYNELINHIETNSPDLIHLQSDNAAKIGNQFEGDFVVCGEDFLPLPSSPSNHITLENHIHTSLTINDSCKSEQCFGSRSIHEQIDRLEILPTEIILSILEYLDPTTTLALSRTCIILQKICLAENIWLPHLKQIALSCKIENSLLNRNDSIPSFLRYCAINRWSDTYKAMEFIIKRLESDLAPQVQHPRSSQEIKEDREEFSKLFDKMMPSVSPWNPSNIANEEVLVKLPPNIFIVQLEESQPLLSVLIELQRGAYYRELLAAGRQPVLEFVIFGGVLERPVVTCKTKDIYHPKLTPAGRLELTSQSAIMAENSAKAIEALVMEIQDAFTEIGPIASDFTL